MKFKMNIIKFLYYPRRLCDRRYSDNLAVNVDHLHVKRIHFVSFIYIVIEDYTDKRYRTFIFDGNLNISHRKKAQTISKL
jgi:hypothetical protein